MKSYANSSPLCPYLHPVPNHFSLRISLSTEDPAVLEKTPFPFSVIVDSDPLTRLNEGHLVTDAGSEIRKVFILVQRDQYLLKRDELWPIHNPDIEECWQKAFSFHASAKKESPLILLSNQVKESGGLAPFQSLFLCKTRRAFFPPPCPSCGSPLEQCYDDDLLSRAGLQPYSTSLKRYLFCPACRGRESSSFFVYELESSDPPTVMDRRDLTREFGRLLDKGGQAEQFPCVSCTLCQECYRSDRLALARIAPFAFYPFYAFIFEALSLNGPDFLSLLSGAGFEDLEGQLKAKGEWGRIQRLKALNPSGLKKAPSLYENDERHFLEIFYLKLSFLAELIRNILGERHLSLHPDLRLSLDGVWVSLEATRGLLPFFWNFKVKYIDLCRIPVEGQSSVPSSGWEGVFLGQVWFYTLLANRKQNMAALSQSLKRTGDQSSSPVDFPREESFQGGADPAFLPENIFWTPEGKKVNQNWRPLWERALQLGWQLLRMGWQKDPQWSQEDFSKQLEDLRGDVKGHLFSPAPSGVIPAVSLKSDAVHDALLRILEKWRRGLPLEKMESKETIILSPQGVQRETPAPPAEKDRGEMVPETVILSREKAQEKGRKVEEAVSETVILSPGEVVQKTARSPGPPIMRDMGKDKAPTSKEAEEGEVGQKRKEKAEDDLLSETVILGPEKIRELSKKK